MVQLVELVGDEVLGQGVAAQRLQHGRPDDREGEAGVRPEEVHDLVAGLGEPQLIVGREHFAAFLGGERGAVHAPRDGLGIRVDHLARDLREGSGDAPRDGEGHGVVRERPGEDLLDHLRQARAHRRALPGEVGDERLAVVFERQHQDLLLAQFDRVLGVQGGARLDQVAGCDPVPAVLAESGAPLGEAHRAAAADVRVGEELAGARRVREHDALQP